MTCGSALLDSVKTIREPPLHFIQSTGLLEEMRRSRDRSFCCGGGGLALFLEPEEEERMGVARVRMAAEAGANVIVTSCPFCMVNVEDAIKVAGMDGKMTAIDLAELVDRQVARACQPADSIPKE